MGSCCCRTEEFSSSKDRFTQIALTPQDPLKVIEGYQKESLVSLEEALRPFQNQIDRLSEQIIEAKRNCRQLSEHGLTSDQAAAIYLYSMKTHSNSVFHHLQRTWLSNDRSEMKLWFKYLRLFNSGLNKLPDAKIDSWQGIVHSDQWERRLKSNSFPVFTFLGSTSPSFDLIKTYLIEKSSTKIIFICYENLKSKDVTGYTHADFREIFLQPGTAVIKSENVQMLPNGSMIFRFTDKSTHSISFDGFSSGSLTPISVKHFVCPNKNCAQRCSGNHQNHHCLGCELVRHVCSHHCGPTNHCDHCRKHNVNLRQCKNCAERFCDNCCLK